MCQDEIFAYLNKELVQKSRQVAILEARVQELELQVQYHQSDFDTRLMEEKVCEGVVCVTVSLHVPVPVSGTK